MCSDIELAWAAGFYDGEGCTRHHYGSCVTMSVSQNSHSADDPPIPLLRFQAALGGLGKITKVKEVKRARPLFYRWDTAKDARTAFALLRPYLSEIKQQQGDQAIARADTSVPGRNRLRKLALAGTERWNKLDS